MPIRRLDRPSLPDGHCARAALRPAMSFGSFMLDSPPLDRPSGMCQTLVQALRPLPSGDHADRACSLEMLRGSLSGFLTGLAAF